jgi:hypothetical protein
MGVECNYDIKKEVFNFIWNKIGKYNNLVIKDIICIQCHSETKKINGSIHVEYTLLLKSKKSNEQHLVRQKFGSKQYDYIESKLVQNPPLIHKLYEVSILFIRFISLYIFKVICGMVYTIQNILQKNPQKSDKTHQSNRARSTKQHIIPRIR